MNGRLINVEFVNDALEEVAAAVCLCNNSTDLEILQKSLEKVIRAIGCYRCADATEDKRSKSEHKRRAAGVLADAIKTLEEIDGKTGP